MITWRRARRWFGNHPWVIIFAVIIVLPFTWLGKSALVTGTDINFPLDPIERFSTRTSLWDDRFITGLDQSVALPTQVFAGVQAMARSTGASLKLVEEIELVFWLGAASLAIVFFLEELLANQSADTKRWGVVLGLTAYIFNLFLVNRVNEVDVATLGAMVAMPVILGAALAVWSNRLRPWHAAAVAALATFIGVGLFANPPLVLTLVLFFAVFAIIGALTHSRKENWHFIQFFGLLLLLIGVTEAWWLIPYIHSLQTLTSGGPTGLGGLTDLLSWVDGVSRHTSFWNVLRMQGAWDWYEKGIGGVPYVPVSAIYQHQPLFLGLSLLLPVGTVASILALRKSDKLARTIGWFFVGALVVSLVYSMGTNNPLSRWIYGHTANIIPYFSLIRSPWYKFAYITTLAYSVLFALLSIGITRWIRPIRIRALVLGGIVIGLMVYAFPFLWGSRYLFAYTRIAALPNYVTETTHYLNQQPDTHRAVTLPQEAAFDYTWGYGSGGDILGDLLHRPVLSNLTFAGADRTGADAVLASFYQALYDQKPTALRILDYLDGYWFIHKNDSKVSDYARSDDSTYIRNRIAAQPGIVGDQSFGQWDLYHRTTPPPGRITTSTRIWTLFGDPTATVKALPDLLNYLPNDGGATAFYVEPATGTAGLGTTRSVLLESFPFLKNGNPIETFDFPSPFAGHVIAHEIINSTRGRVTINNSPLVDGSETSLTTTSNTLKTTEIADANRLANSSFATAVPLALPGDGPWKFADASQGLPGNPNFSATQVAGSDSTPAIELHATDHILVMCQEVPNVPANSLVRVTFDYRHVSGQNPAFAVTQDGNNIVQAGPTLTGSDTWQTATMSIETNVNSNRASVCFYAGAKPGETTVNQYDNVRLRIIGYRSTLGFFSDETQTPAPPHVDFHQVSPTKWIANVGASQSPYLLSFLESFAPGWTATVNGTTVASDKHVAIDGYANAWWLDASSQPQTVVISYAPQQQFAQLSIGSLLALIGTVGILCGTYYRTRSKRRR